MINGETYAGCYNKLEEAWHLIIEAEQGLQRLGRESTHIMDRVAKARIEMDVLASEIGLDTPEQRQARTEFLQRDDGTRMPISKVIKKNTNKEQA